MTEAVARCGPDGEGVWAEGHVGLGHRMLHTTPESLGETLPVSSADGTCTITADARIDNRSELLGELGLPGESADSALILAAYERWGEDCLDRLVGDFAFALWDASRGALFCARDHFGVKPFYYHHAPPLFACATEIKALLTVPGVPERLNEVRLADFLATMREDRENTIYEDIVRLPAAHALVVSKDGLRRWRYYALTPAADVPADASDEEYEARFRELFTEAVRVRLRSAFPIGSELSGGMDSSSVTSVARHLLPPEEPLHTISIIYDDVTECDERPYIDEVLRQGNFVPHYVYGDRLGPLENVDSVYTHLDDGLASGNQHLVWAAKGKAREAGVRVLLDGLDGDNVVGHGLLYLKELADAGDWKGLAEESRAVARVFATTEQRHNFEDSFADPDTAFKRFGKARLQRLAANGPWWRFLWEVNAASLHFGVSRFSLLKRYRGAFLEPKAMRKKRLARQTGPAPGPAPILPLLNPEFAARVGLNERLAHFSQYQPALTAERDVQRQLLGGSRIQTALELTSHVGAAHGLEIRHPFFDKRLVEFCLALPASQSLKAGWTRSILRRSLTALPEAIRWRVGKAWMGSNFERGLYEQDAGLLEQHVTDLGPLRPYVDEAVVRDLYGRGRHVPNIEQAQLARIATLVLWLKKRFVSHTAPGLSRGGGRGEEGERRAVGA